MDTRCLILNKQKLRATRETHHDNLCTVFNPTLHRHLLHEVRTLRPFLQWYALLIYSYPNRTHDSSLTRRKRKRDENIYRLNRRINNWWIYSLLPRLYWLQFIPPDKKDNKA